ncbi:RNA polymerase sigma factor [Liquorilactobacillus nagelii]|uniref:RNA polymerase sigma factor n=1 Tax=Liquorilactobacillus nagelii TaxID=82688 RepID=UPI0039E9DBCC
MKVNRYEQVLLDIIPELIIFLQKLGATKTEAEDLSQDIFIKAWQMDLELSPLQLKAYLKKTAKSHYIDLRRHQQRAKIIIDRFGPTLLKEVDDSVFCAETIKNKQRLFGALEKLTLVEQKLILERYQQRDSIQKIAEKNSLSQAAVKMRLYRVKRKLRRLMKRGWKSE